MAVCDSAITKELISTNVFFKRRLHTAKECPTDGSELPTLELLAAKYD